MEEYRKQVIKMMVTHVNTGEQKSDWIGKEIDKQH